MLWDRSFQNGHGSWCCAVCAVLVAACSSDIKSSPGTAAGGTAGNGTTSSGGATVGGTVGQPATGGTPSGGISNGGTSSGGTPSQGGTVSTGGTSGSGGAATSGGLSGQTGGGPNGGSVATGGNPTSGGSNGGNDATTGGSQSGGGPVGGSTGMAGTGGNGMSGGDGCDSGPLDAPVPNCAPDPPPSTGDFYQDCVDRINQFRWDCQCLPPLERYTEAEDCADQHAQYDYEVDQAHAGIQAGICQPGQGSQNECPDYAPRFDIVDYCLQQMWDEGPGSDFQAHGHYINMSDTNVTRVACGRYETPEGNIWSVQNFFR